MNAVFNTTELLEQIISHLPIHQVFAVQRVSRRWKEVINSSSKIQKKMWLRSSSTRVLAPSIVPEISGMCIYPDLVEMNPLTKRESQTALRLPYEVISNSDGMFTTTWIILNGVWRYFLMKSSPEDDSMPALWHRAYLTEPPVTTVRIGVPMLHQEMGDNVPLSINITCPEGITMGRIKHEIDTMARCALRRADAYMATSDNFPVNKNNICLAINPTVLLRSIDKPSPR